MIKVEKSTAAPPVLLGQGKTANDAIVAAYIKDNTAYNNPKSLTIKNAIYGHTTVKTSLKNAQHNKCCFCEKSQVDEFGAVEHFRPKNGYQVARKSPLARPGYFWLGYSWPNLFFVCGACNSTYKGNLFPLQNEARRATSHLSDITLEDPLLLDPGGTMDPRDHIYFDKELVKWHTTYGQHTIEICGLDREALNDKRKKLLGDIDARIIIIYQASVHTKEDVEKAKAFIRNAIKPEAEFSSAAKCHIAQLIDLKED